MALFQPQLSMRRWRRPAASRLRSSLVAASGEFRPYSNTRKGVIRATSGYSGGSAKTAEYELVSTGETGHAESVQITYDPSKITYGQLLRVFFSVAHDPTQLNRQGPDSGTQYRSSIFYGSDEQKRIAEAYIAQLDKAKVFQRPIVTQVVPLKAFYPAEAVGLSRNDCGSRRDRVATTDTAIEPLAGSAAYLI